MKFKPRRELKRTKIEIIPMIDTMFFLLVFFMLSSLALTRINGIKVNLPKTNTAPPEPTSKIMLTITKEQKYLLNNAEIRAAELQGALRQEISNQHLDLDTTSFIINADESVPHGLVVRSIDASRSVGITHFAIATEPERISP